MKVITPKTLLFHGNENKDHVFSEIRPSFFTTDRDYASCYGKHVYPYKLKFKKLLDTSVDEVARAMFNNDFRNDELGKDAAYLEKGRTIPFIDADNFWAFVVTEELQGKGHGYDSMIVDEGTHNKFKTSISIVPFDRSQIVRSKEKNLALEI